jgi:hypothetical protein
LTDVQLRHQTLHAPYQVNPPAARIPVPPGEAEFIVLPDSPDPATAQSTVDSTVRAALDLTAGRVWRTVLTRCAGSTLRATVRTDIVPAGLADRIVTNFVDVLERGPARLSGVAAAALPAGG